MIRGVSKVTVKNDNEHEGMSGGGVKLMDHIA